MDDEALIRNMVTRMLVHGGYEVVTAKDGAEAVAICTVSDNIRTDEAHVQRVWRLLQEKAVELKG